MKITKETLKQIIKEELSEAIAEGRRAKQKAHDARAAKQKAWRAKADARAAGMGGWPFRARWNDEKKTYWIQNDETQEHIEDVPAPE